MPFAELRPAFARAALAHYAHFGHSAIYVLKTGQLLAKRPEGAAAEPLLLALTPHAGARVARGKAAGVSRL